MRIAFILDTLRKIRKLLYAELASKRGWLIVAGASVFVYAIAVLLYVQSNPDLGLKSAFGTEIKDAPVQYRGPVRPREGDVVTAVGSQEIATWPDLLHAAAQLREKIDRVPDSELGIERESGEDDEEKIWVKVEFSRGGERFTAWCVLGTLAFEDLAPSILWFFLKMMLFLVGALVLWTRPSDTAAAMFFLVCIVTLGAYMGGYHWNNIAGQPVLLLIFMVCAIMMPVVSLHFYLIFPSRKPWLERYPVRVFLGMYGVPMVFLAVLIFLYFRARGFVQVHEVAGIRETLEQIRLVTYVYLGVAGLWYLLCVASLIYSFRTVRDELERNQVKWIMFGAVLAIVPISYSFYLAVWEPDAFGAGAATWPMFAASVCVTAAFAVSITRYRLMEFDQIISSGVGYFFISFLAGLVYYGVVFLGTLVFNQVIASPKVSEALAVSTTALVLMFLLDLARARFKKALDRRFYKDKSQLDRTLQQMREAIGQLVDPPALAQRLLQASTELLGAARGAVYLRQGDSSLFRLVGSLGTPPLLTELSPGCPLIESLQQHGVVQIRPRPGIPLGPAQRQLQFIGGEIAHPLAHEGRLLALLVLGPKDSPYRPEDLDLLAAFAQITVLALESTEGHRTIELLNLELQAKVEKISEQQRRILALQSQLRRQHLEDKEPSGNGASANGTPAGGATSGEPGPAPLPGGIVGSGPVVSQLLHLVRKVASTDAVVLIRGESGTGKELLARAVHETSARAGKAFVKVHCAALSAGLLESELFGHVKGAFTGAHRDKIGRFELANGGTLFLDEIGDINLEVQTKLLRVLQEKVFERVGSSESTSVDVRIITATHQNLEDLIQKGRFREDLFYRLNVFPIVVPPLRERPEDIPELVMHFVRQSGQRCRKEVSQIDDDTLALLKGYKWPGNVRQLENVIERAVVIAEGPIVTVQELPPDILRVVESPPAGVAPPDHHNGEAILPATMRYFSSSRAERERLEREHLVRSLAAADGNKAEAARALGIARSTLLSRLKKLGLS